MPHSVLRQRILTALVLILSLTTVLFYCTSAWIAVLFGFVVAVGAWEWAALAGLSRRRQRILYTGSLVFFGGVGVFGVLYFPAIIQPLLTVAVLWWLWVGSKIIFSPRSPGPFLINSYGKLISGFFILIPAWISAFLLHRSDPQSPVALLFLLALVALADSAAYFAGRAFGRTKLAPHISPGKTLEGLLGGLVAVMPLAYFCGTIIWGFKAEQLGLWVILVILVALVSVLGDLTESKFKRLAGVKDSGHILPGHGGVLDRVDAFTAAAPVFTLIWLYMIKPQT